MNLFNEAPTPRAIGGHHSAVAKTHTWLTPPEWIAALGLFDLDPCACPQPRPWATARMHWTREDSPLSRSWPAEARVWLNPPFGPEDVTSAFLGRMADHGRGTALLFGRTETKQWHRFVWPSATAILFVESRPHFHHQDGRRAAANSGAPVDLIAYGEDDARRLEASGIPGAFVRLRPL